jgi:superfamily II DNA/RNA helicase
VFDEEGDLQIPRISEPHGVVILVPTRELSLYYYEVLRKVADSLAVVRTTNIADFVGVAKFLRDDKPADFLLKQQQNNRIRGLKWDRTDVLISTPSQLTALGRTGELTPRALIIDEADLLLQNQIYQETTISAIKSLPTVS